MKTVFNLKTQSLNLSDSFDRDIKPPATATLEQVAQFDELVSSIQLTPMEAISKAYEDCFGEELEDDADIEESPNEEVEGEV